ncbi:MAG: hypothetical protein INR71_01610 [Terriglobus roseus]|nr:hypothetical protein [Terriglobus roseus]
MTGRNIASDFGATLDSIFDTDDSLFSLSVDVQQKYVAPTPQLSISRDLLTSCSRKEAITSQSKELEALEAQLRETESRLRKAKRQSISPTSPGPSSAPMNPAAENQQLPIRGNVNMPSYAPPPIPHKASDRSLSSQPSAHQTAGRPHSAVSNHAQRSTTSQRA